jgi:hypothetical protein
VRRLCWLLLFLYVASSVRSLVRLIPAYSIDRYIAPWYYVNYTDGFVRRGLAGEVLRLVWTQSKVPVEFAGWGVSFIGVLGCLFIGYRIVLLASGATARLVTATLLVLSPLGLTTVIRDPGRFEDIGMMAMAVMVLVAARRASPVVTVAAAAVVTAIAVASEELVLPYIAPVVLALLLVNLNACRREGEQRVRPGARCAGLLSLAFLPGVAIWLGVYLATIVGVRIVIGPLGRWYWPSAAYMTLVTLVILFSGIDIRRWWTISLVAHFSVVAILRSRERVPKETKAWVGRVAPVALVAVFIVSLYGQTLPNTVRPDGYYGGSYVDVLTPFWIEGEEAP